MIKKALFFFLLPALIFSQAKVIHFKKLQDFLPKLNVEKFQREKPTGSTQTAMGFTTSYAEVNYREQVPDTAQNYNPIEFSIKITDASLYPAMLMSFLMMPDYDSENDGGYEKTLMVKDKYKGMLRAQTEESKSIELSFAVANRFLIEIRGSNTDSFEMLQSFLKDMDLEKLETAKPE
ncbi:MAG: hypothetical protein Fur0015_15380 [Ignavibacteriales bacterium]